MDQSKIDTDSIRVGQFAVDVPSTATPAQRNWIKGWLTLVGANDGDPGQLAIRAEHIGTDGELRLSWLTNDLSRWQLVIDRDAGGSYNEGRYPGPGVIAEQPKRTQFGGHEFSYVSTEDLFRCDFCQQFEVQVRTDAQTITPCPGMAGYQGDNERVYLLVTLNPALPHSGFYGAFCRRVFDTGIGRSPRFSPRHDGGRELQLIETAPSVVDELEHKIRIMRPSFQGDTTGMPDCTFVTDVERLTAQQGREFLGQNRAAYAVKYGTERL